jgi:hypothetical protein
MRYTKEQIDHWISDYIQSKQTLKLFCEDKPFHSSSLSNWLRKRKQKSSFIELTPPLSEMASIEIRHPDGSIIHIRKELSISEIIQLVRC